jgi:hypothetical protein
MKVTVHKSEQWNFFHLTFADKDGVMGI